MALMVYAYMYICSYTIGTANQIYFKPFSHVGSFCIGVVLGYFLYVSPKMKLSKVHKSLVHLT